MKQQEKIIIRKYTNRRLYNTSTGNFVTLDKLREMVKNNATREL